MPDFYFRTSTLRYKLLAIPKELRYICTFFLSMTIIFCWFFFIYKPLQTTLSHYSNTIAQLLAAKAIEAQTLLNNEQLQQKLFTQEQELIAAQNSYQQTYKPINETITCIFDYAHKANLAVNCHTPKKTINESWYTIYAFKTEFHGSFKTILDFLDLLKNNEAHLHIKNLKIHKINSNSLSLIGDFSTIKIKEDCHDTSQTVNT